MTNKDVIKYKYYACLLHFYDMHGHKDELDRYSMAEDRSVELLKHMPPDKINELNIFLDAIKVHTKKDT